MCDMSDTRRSRRKQCTPSRHSDTASKTMTVPLPDHENNTMIEGGSISSGEAGLKQVSDRLRQFPEE